MQSTRSKQWRWSWTLGEPPPPALPPLTIMDSTVTTVESFRFLGTIISRDLKWDNHIDAIAKKAQQRLHFLRQLRKFNQSQELLKQFYSAITESVLCSFINFWFGSLPNQTSRGYSNFSFYTSTSVYIIFNLYIIIKVSVFLILLLYSISTVLFLPMSTPSCLLHYVCILFCTGSSCCQVKLLVCKHTW